MVMAAMLEKMSQLEQISLNLEDNQIGSEGAQPFFEAIRNLPTVADFTLNFSGNVVGSTANS